MSKSTLSALKSELKIEYDIAYKAENDLKHLDKLIYNAMEDRVGRSARESLASIRDRFACNINEGLKSVEKATVALDRGYSKIDEASAKTDAILRRARYIVKELDKV